MACSAPWTRQFCSFLFSQCKFTIAEIRKERSFFWCFVNGSKQRLVNQIQDILLILRCEPFIFLAVRGLNITRCLGPFNDSYTCPGLSDPPGQTHCCLSNSQPACCLPGGSSCSDNTDKRNYCPRANDENDRTQCCVWDSQPTCCLPGGSKCSDNADIRNYCPGPNDGKNDRDCCESDQSVPRCCK